MWKTSHHFSPANLSSFKSCACMPLPLCVLVISAHPSNETWGLYAVPSPVKCSSPSASRTLASLNRVSSYNQVHRWDVPVGRPFYTLLLMCCVSNSTLYTEDILFVVRIHKTQQFLVESSINTENWKTTSSHHHHYNHHKQILSHKGKHAEYSPVPSPLLLSNLYLLSITIYI